MARHAHRSLLPRLAGPLSRRDEQGRAEARQYRRTAARRAQDPRSRCAVQEMDEFGDYRQVISLPNPPIEDFATPGQGLALARIANDAMAELCQKHPDRFAGFVAALCLTDVMGSVEEAKRAINQLGAAGVQIFSPLAGRPLDEPVFEPLLRRHGAARPADLAASGAHRGDARLCRRAEIALRNVVVFRLALRHLGRHGAAGVLRPVRPLSEPENHHPPSRRHDPVLRRPHRPRPRRARPTHAGRGLFENPAVAETAAPRLHARLLRRHRHVRRRRPRAALRASNSSAPTRWCSPPTPRSARSSRRSRR